MLSLSKWFYATFAGRRDTYGVQRPKGQGIEYYRVTGKEMLYTDYDNHLKGDQILGVYPALANNSTYFAVVDIDEPRFDLVQEVCDMLPQPNYVEKSRSGNYHIWMFFKEAISIPDVQIACQNGIDYAQERMTEHCGLYPIPIKDKGVGLLIALPFQGKLIDHGLTCFINKVTEEPIDIHMLKQEFKLIPTTKFYKSIQNTDREISIDEDVIKDATLYHLWMGMGKTKGDTSSSGYDFTFSKALAVRGYDAKEIKLKLSQRPQVHSLDSGYLDKTIAQACEAAVSYTTDTKRKRRAAKTNAKKSKNQKTPPPEEEPDTSMWDDLRPITRDDFYHAVKDEFIFDIPQRQHMDIFIATMIANIKTTGRPVWLLMIGPPGSGKTMPMMAIQNSPISHTVSSFKPTALISGWGLKGQEDMSLIPKLNNKILLVKDMSSVLSQNREVVAEILGLLRDAYDGSCSKAYGTGIARAYESRFGFIGATTPDIDSNWSLNVRLGERFLRYRVRSTLEHVYGKIDMALATLMDEPAAEGLLEEAALSWMKHLLREGGQLPKLHLSMAKQVGRLAQIGAILRTGVARNAYNNNILVVPEWEEATRYAKQLAKLGLSLAFIRDRDKIGHDEFEDLKAVVRDSIEGRTERLCQILFQNPNIEATAITQLIRLPDWTVRQILSDLEIARIVISTRNGYETAWDFSPWIRGQLEHFQLWHKTSQTNVYKEDQV